MIGKPRSAAPPALPTPSDSIEVSNLTVTPLHRAIQELDNGQPGHAAQVLKEHLWREPEDALAYATLGVALAQLGHSRFALEAMERAHYLQPADTRILYNYGLVLIAAGRTREAALRFTAALKLDPTYERAMRRLAQMEAEAAQEMGVEALARLPDLQPIEAVSAHTSNEHEAP